MAINPSNRYPNNVDPASTEYPYGKARDVTVPGDGTGTPWESALVNDLFGFQQAILSQTGAVPSGTPETATESQFLDNLIKLSGRRFNSVSDMSASTHLKVGQIVTTEGYYSPGDGGANRYEVVASGTGTDDGGSYIDLGTNQAKGLFPDGKSRPKQFGARGDGVTVDTVALQSWVDFTEKQHDPGEGNYLTLDVNLTNPNISIIGDYRATFSQAAHTTLGVFVITADNVTLGGFEIDGRDQGNYGVGPNQITMKNGDVGVLIGGVTRPRLNGLIIHGCTNLGVGVRTPTSPAACVDLEISDCIIYGIGERKTGYLTGGQGGNCIAVGDTANKPAPTVLRPRVLRNLCFDCHSTLISMGSCDDFTLLGNVCYDSDSNAVQVGTNTRNGMIHFNHLSDLTGFANADVENRGISVDPSGTVEKQISVVGNFVRSAQLYGIDIRVPGMTVNDNVIINTGDNYQGSAPENIAGIAAFTGGWVANGNHVIASAGHGVRAFINNVDMSPFTLSATRVQSSSLTAIALDRAAGGTARFKQPKLLGNIVTTTVTGSGISVAYADQAQILASSVDSATGAGLNIVECASPTIDQNVVSGSGSSDVLIDAATTNVVWGLTNQYATSSFLGSFADYLPPGDLNINIGSGSNRFNSVHARLVFFGSGTVLASGAGSPEGNLVAVRGSIYTDTDTGDIYKKTTAAGSFGWSLI